MRFGVEQEQQPGERGHRARRHGIGRTLAAERTGDCLGQPAAISRPPIMSDEMLLPAGRRAAPTPSSMIAIPATREPRARMRSDNPRPAWVAKLHPAPLSSLPRTLREGRGSLTPGRNDPQGALSDPILQRRRFAHHFSVERDTELVGGLPTRSRSTPSMRSMSSSRAPVEQRADDRRDEPAPRLLAHHHDAQLAVVQAFALPRGADVEPVVVVADEQQRRIDQLLLVVDRQRQALMVEPGERA